MWRGLAPPAFRRSSWPKCTRQPSACGLFPLPRCLPRALPAPPSPARANTFVSGGGRRRVVPVSMAVGSCGQGEQESPGLPRAEQASPLPHPPRSLPGSPPCCQPPQSQRRQQQHHAGQRGRRGSAATGSPCSGGSSSVTSLFGFPSSSAARTFHLNRPA